jgi:transcription antitermination factor NusG
VRRTVRGQREDREAPLFPGYCFVWIELQWHRARWCPGVVRLIMDGVQPAKVSNTVIEEIRGRERNGAIELPRRLLKPGDRVRLLTGPFQGHLAIYAGMSGSAGCGIVANSRWPAAGHTRPARYRGGWMSGERASASVKPATSVSA